MRAIRGLRSDTGLAKGAIPKPIVNKCVAGPCRAKTNRKKLKMNTKITLALSSLNPVKTLILLWRVFTHLTGNLNFTTPKVPLVDMQGLAEDLQTAISDAKDGSKLNRAHRDALTQQAKTMLATQAAYVIMEAGGDYEKLVSSGYQLAKPPVTVVTPEIPQNVQARTGSEKGEVELRFTLSIGAHMYGMYKSESDPDLGAAEWVLVAQTTRARNTISGLESYKPYWFRVEAIGVNGTSLMSNATQAVAA
jgi:hypothetical protein